MIYTKNENMRVRADEHSSVLGMRSMLWASSGREDLQEALHGMMHVEFALQYGDGEACMAAVHNLEGIISRWDEHIMEYPEEHGLVWNDEVGGWDYPGGDSPPGSDIRTLEQIAFWPVTPRDATRNFALYWDPGYMDLYGEMLRTNLDAAKAQADALDAKTRAKAESLRARELSKAGAAAFRASMRHGPAGIENKCPPATMR